MRTDKDTRQKLEEDIRSYVLHVGEATVMSERTDEQVVHGWLDRQAAITRAELQGCPGYDADRHYCKYHANDFDLTREQVCELKREVSRLERERDELQAKLDQCMESYADAKDSRDKLQAKLDAYDETHILLPLDADGVPIRLGDELESAHGGKVIVEYVGECEVRVYRDGEHYRISQDEYACTCRHVKERTVEDVLARFLTSCGDDDPHHYDEQIAEYADELRGLMEVE